MFVRFALNSFIVLDSLTCDGRAFQSSTTLFEKKFFLISVLHLFFLRFSGCDEERVCITVLFWFANSNQVDLSTSLKPLIILNAWIRSAFLLLV